LKHLGLERYARAFQADDIDAAVLSDLTAEDLAGLGVTSIGHRRKLLAAIADLRADRKPLLAAAPIKAPASLDLVLPAQPGEAERRQLTLMFVDLVGSTGLSQKLDPEELSTLIRTYQNAVAGEIARFEGHVAKLMGDGVLCYFGWPRAHEDAAERAIRAGLAIAHAVSGLRDPEGDSLAARVGIATGLVVVGDLVGEGRAQERTVAGETPNLAARLQAAARPREVLIAASTRRLIGDLFVLEDRGDLQVKGYQAPVHAYAILDAGTPGSRFGALHGATLAPLVGREAELALLLDCCGRATRGGGQVVLLGGEPGIGKSRLIEALRSRLAEMPHACIECQCSPLHAQSALYPFASELERAAGFRRDDDAATRRGALAALLAQRLEDAGPSIPILAKLLGLSGDDQLSPDLTPQQLKAKTLASLAAQVKGLAARQPLLLVFEDAHWADPSSLELLGGLVDAATGLPVLVLVSHRPEFAPRWIDRPHVTSVALSRLNSAEAATLVEKVAGAGQFPPRAVERVVAKTDGVPLFIEELVRAMLAAKCQGDVGADQLGSQLTAVDDIPSTLHDLLAARLEHLGSAKQVLQIGAVVGREFSRAHIAIATQLSDREVDDSLDRAVDSGLIVREGIGQAANYRFRHALIHEAAYASMLRSRRRALHARIAQMAEAGAPEFRHAQPEWLARHCIEAGDAGRAALLWLEAGRRAKAAFATNEATAHLLSCLEATSAEGAKSGVTSDLQRIRAEALIMLGDLASLSDDLAAADEHYRRAIDEAPEPDMRRRIENKRHHRRTVSRGNTTIACYEHGSGLTTLLFVSTQAVGIAMFQPMLERLCDEFRIVTVDPRGSGGSTALIRPYPCSQHAADVRAVIAALNTPHLVGVGLSMGANVLFRIVDAEPGLLQGIVTIGAPVEGHRRPFFPEDWLQLQQALRETGAIEPMLRLHVARVFSEPEMHEMLDAIVRSRLRLPHDTLASFFLDDWEDDVTGILPTITTPTLVTHGRDDRLVSFKAAELAMSLLPNARLHAFDGKGHLPIFTATNEFCEVVRGFVRDIGRLAPHKSTCSPGCP
jgi:class 3 adenylate cyclase/pimeloyl-ACP methyl ester carboxylesterase